MIWLKNLYITESVRPRIQKILKAAEADDPSGKVSAFLIMLSIHPEAQLDVVSLKEISHPMYHEGNLSVIGVAGSKKEAFALLERIASDCLKGCGDPYLKRYFSGADFVSKGEVII